jgi:hypothetical protein
MGASLRAEVTADLVEGTGNFRCCFWKDVQGQNHLSGARSLALYLSFSHTHSLSLFSSSERFFTGGRGSGAPNKTHPITCRFIRSLVVTDITENIRIQPGGTEESGELMQQKKKSYLI